MQKPTGQPIGRVTERGTKAYLTTKAIALLAAKVSYCGAHTVCGGAVQPGKIHSSSKVHSVHANSVHPHQAEVHAVHVVSSEIGHGAVGAAHAVVSVHAWGWREGRRGLAVVETGTSREATVAHAVITTEVGVEGKTTRRGCGATGAVERGISGGHVEGVMTGTVTVIFKRAGSDTSFLVRIDGGRIVCALGDGQASDGQRTMARQDAMFGLTFMGSKESNPG